MNSCGQNTVDTYHEYLSWLNDEENGLVKGKEAGGITVKVKQLPSNYLAYQDLLKEKEIKISHDRFINDLLTLLVCKMREVKK